MKLGIDHLFNVCLKNIKDASFGILAHGASITSSGRHILEMAEKNNLNVKVLLGPEHGFNTTAQDMEAVPNSTTKGSDGLSAGKIPIYSLYGKTFESLKPTTKMLKGIDFLIIDLQDIGSRYYTYIYTMAFCMETAAKTGTKVIVCDRPNPINGTGVEGNLQEDRFRSFVGYYPLPVRHGMTIGELATYFNEEFKIGCDLNVIKMEEWQRGWYWNDCNIKWENPSPNMRSLDAANLYPGICLLEGTNVSEGRGTETPFETIGAPFVDKDSLVEKLYSYDLAGVRFHPTTFVPSMQKWSGQKCDGVKFEITDRKRFRPYLTGLAVVHALSGFNGFKWRTDKYEFRDDVPAIDLLTGSPYFRKEVDKGAAFGEISAELTKTPASFLEVRKKYLIY